MLCDQGGTEHTVPIHVGPWEERPEELHCTRCGLRFVKYAPRENVYLPEGHPSLREDSTRRAGKQEALLG